MADAGSRGGLQARARTKNQFRLTKPAPFASCRTALKFSLAPGAPSPLTPLIQSKACVGFGLAFITFLAADFLRLRYSRFLRPLFALEHRLHQIPPSHCRFRRYRFLQIAVVCERCSIVWTIFCS